jgi:phosphatidylethanolamine/phosphatidyl-N-methylethanolamine N-methyltransferase
MRGTSEQQVTTRPAVAAEPAALESSRRSYRLFAPLYDFVFGASLRHGRRVAIAALDCRPGERVLELCIGSGLSLPFYPRHASVIGIDLSSEMLAMAARRLRRLGAGPSCHLLQMSAERLAFADASFDKAVVLFALSGLPDPARAVRELRRVCRPGATIVIANRFRGATWLRVFDVLLSPLYRLLRYRVDLDRDALLAQAGLELLEARPANLLGYSTVLVCRSR